MEHNSYPELTLWGGNEGNRGLLPMGGGIRPLHDVPHLRPPCATGPAKGQGTVGSTGPRKPEKHDGALAAVHAGGVHHRPIPGAEGEDGTQSRCEDAVVEIPQKRQGGTHRARPVQEMQNVTRNMLQKRKTPPPPLSVEGSLPASS